MNNLTFAQLAEANATRQREWDSGDVTNTLLYRAVELGGEAGEALNEAKKLERERLGVAGSRSTLAKLAEELADVVICAQLVAATQDIDLAAAVVTKFNATSDKIGLKTKL